MSPDSELTAKAREVLSGLSIRRLWSEVMPNGLQHARYRIVGAPINPEWTVREGAEPWCEITTWGIGDKRSIGSFGGEMWPGAWNLTMTQRQHGRDVSVLVPVACMALDIVDGREVARLLSEGGSK